ncbi:MAG: hypothetical protein KAU20_02240 [Nanoarchaeota archaeon]|nr:hypothetical protein [Nanoarchaeota archaeon]
MGKLVQPVGFVGDFKEDGAVHFKWSTADQNGASITRSTQGTVKVYKDNNTAQSSTSGITDTKDFHALTGIHACTIDLSSDAFYAHGHNYTVICQDMVVDTKAVSDVIGQFSIENRAADIRKINGGKTDGNNAVLKLKQLHIINDANSAAIHSEGAGGGAASHGIKAIGDTGANGIDAEGAVAGINGRGGSGAGGQFTSVSGKGVYIQGASGQIGLHVAGINQAAVKLEGSGTGSPYGLWILSAANSPACYMQGYGDGAGLYCKGGVTGKGVQILGGNTSGSGLEITAVDGHGIQIVAQGNKQGVWIEGSGTGNGMYIKGGASGDGIHTEGGATIGEGIHAKSTGANGILAQTVLAAGNGIKAQGGGSGAGLIASGGTGITGEGVTHGIEAIGNQDGIHAETVSPSSGHGIRAIGLGGHGIYATGDTDFDGIRAVGTGTGSGLKLVKGATGKGVDAQEIGSVFNIDGVSGAGILDILKLFADSVGGGNFDKTTDSLEKISEGLGSVTGDVNVVAISGDGGAADALEAILDGTGARIDLTKLKINASDANGAVEILNAAGKGINIVATGGEGIYCQGTTGVYTKASSSTGKGMMIESGANGIALYLKGTNVSGLEIYGGGFGGAAVHIKARGGSRGDGIRVDGDEHGVSFYSGGGGTYERHGFYCVGNGKAGSSGIKANGTSNGSRGMTLFGAGFGAYGLVIQNGSSAGVATLKINNTGSAAAPAVQITGYGSGAGVEIVGGDNGHGIHSKGGSSIGHGILAEGVAGNYDGFKALGHGDGAGIRAEGGDNNSNGIEAVGIGSGSGLKALAGVTGHGILALGGATSGDGIKTLGQTSGSGINSIGAGGLAGMKISAAGTAVGLDLSGGGTQGAGIHIQGGGGNSQAMLIEGAGNAAGVDILGGTTGIGVSIKSQGGAVGMLIQGQGTDAVGIRTLGNGAGAGFKVEAGTGKAIDAGEIDTILSRIGVPANIDTGGASLADNIKKMCDDSAGTVFDATSDSLAKLRLAIDAAGITPQAVRDAMKLAPSGGAPASGSVDDHLDDILEDTGTTIPASLTDLNNDLAVVDGVVDDTNDRVKLIEPQSQAIYDKLPAGDISDFTEETLLDGIQTGVILQLVLAMVDGRFRVDYPSAGKLTFFKRDNVTALTVVDVTAAGRTRD